MLFSCGANKKIIKLPYSHSHFFCYIWIALYVVEYSANTDGKTSCVKETKFFGKCCPNEHKRATCQHTTHEYSNHLMMYITDKHLLFSTDLFFPAMLLQSKEFLTPQRLRKEAARLLLDVWPPVICLKYLFSSVLEACTAPQHSARVCCSCVARGV